MAYVIKLHKMAFYDNLWHMPYDIIVIKCTNMGIKRTVSIRRIDLWGSEPLESKKKLSKKWKNWNVNFSFVFLDECLCKKDHNFRHGSGPRISISFFASGHLNPTAHFWPWNKYFCGKKYFSAHPIVHLIRGSFVASWVLLTEYPNLVFHPIPIQFEMDV